MHASTFKITIPSSDVFYTVDDPKMGNGLVTTVAAIRSGPSDLGPTEITLHCNRFNLDKVHEREKFAAQAGTEPEQLLEVRARILDYFAPDESPTMEPPEL